MIRSACVASLFCFSFITSPLLCSDRQNKGRKNKSAEITSATNNANVTPLVIHPQETPTTPIQVTPLRNSSPLPSPERQSLRELLRRSSSAGNFTEDEPLSPKLGRSTTSALTQATQTTTSQATSSTSSTAAPVVNGAIATPAQPNAQTTTSTTSTHLTHSNHQGEQSDLQTRGSAPVARVQSSFLAGLWAGVQRTVRCQRTLTEASITAGRFCDENPTEIDRVTTIAHTLTELALAAEEAHQRDYLSRSTDVITYANNNGIRVLPEQQRQLLAILAKKEEANKKLRLLLQPRKTDDRKE
ncbi:MAG: hypothetical protein IT346_02370 [Epsilonproteobacteria bacterium]|nr:hypothetical protein [Campylobacterota bacterium]